MKRLLQASNNWILKFLVGFTLIFIALYPKLPSIQVTHTWVYVRLEDFLISITVLVWFIQLIRKKVSLPLPVGLSIILYWIIGGISLLYSIIFIGPHLANFFPKIAALEYLRRIEYMILFFVSYSTIKSKKDIRDYLIVLCATVFSAVLYGFGQRFYINLWQAFPKFFVSHPFCFPSFQTGNEEFAKGIPLCLPFGARITSTFGGHYDLAAYLVFIAPILIAFSISIKKWLWRIVVGVLSFFSVTLLVLTASRTSFAAYLISATAMLIFFKKKLLIIPVLIVSIALLFAFSRSTVQRFVETIRLTSIVTNGQGQVVGEPTSALPTSLQKKISKNPIILEAPPPTQNLPKGSGFIALPAEVAPVATSVAVVKTSVPQYTSTQLHLANGAVEISTVSGSFLIQKALVYDISFTTRFQAEWPRDWQAFLTSPAFGTGYSSITLASDNDYLRGLGETGFLGLGTFLFIFIILGIFLHEVSPTIKDDYSKAFVFGLAGGITGLFFNASLIDVFESSKVAETLWLLMGMAAGILTIYQTKKISWKENIKAVFTSTQFIIFYFFILLFIFFGNSLMNFFVADDFIWLKWGAMATVGQAIKYFVDATGFFYRPFDKFLMFFLYTFFSFQPTGYHLFMLFLHLLMTAGVFVLGKRLLKNKLMAFFAALLFLLLPGHGENVFWISTISANLCSVFLLYAFILFLKFREHHSVVSYIFALIFALFAFLSYEMSVIVVPLLVLSEMFIPKAKKSWRTILFYLPFVLMTIVYPFVRIRSHAIGFNGDYSYSLPHFLPNFFGNLFGYIGLFAFGEKFLPYYTMLRSTLRTNSIVVVFACIVGVAIVVMLLFKLYKKKNNFYKTEDARIIIFSFLFVIVSLLSFIGLGNISERYGYLASVGFVLLLMYAIVRIISLIVHQKRLALLVVMLCVVFLSYLYARGISDENEQWNQAGRITYKALALFRTNYPAFPQKTNLIFVNVPIRHGQAWIFPVGLKEGLWFIYRDSTFDIMQAKTIAEAKQLQSVAGKNLPPQSKIFLFNDKGDVSEVQ